MLLTLKLVVMIMKRPRAVALAAAERLGADDSDATREKIAIQRLCWSLGK